MHKDDRQKVKKIALNVYGLRLCVLCKQQKCVFAVFFFQICSHSVVRWLLACANDYYDYNCDGNDGDVDVDDDGYEIFSYLYNGNGRLKQIIPD